MKFNTALCLMLSAIGLLALDLKFRHIAIVSSFIAFAISFLTFAEYIPGVDFGIDELFMHAIPENNIMHPGRFAPNTAIAIFLINAAILYLAFQRSLKPPRIGHVTLTVIGSIITAIAAVPLIGYLHTSAGRLLCCARGAGSWSRSTATTAILWQMRYVKRMATSKYYFAVYLLHRLFRFRITAIDSGGDGHAFLFRRFNQPNDIRSVFLIDGAVHFLEYFRQVHKA